MRPVRHSSVNTPDGANKPPFDLLLPEVLALLDHLAEEIAAEYLRLLAPEEGTPVGPDQSRVVEGER
jgi:hypothetical protein